MRVFYENRAISFDSNIVDDLSFIPHLHRQVELVYVSRGQLGIVVENTHKLLEAGELGIVFPNTVHSYDEGVEGRTNIVIFGTELCSEHGHIFSAMQAACPFLARRQVHEDIPFILGQLHKEWRAQPNAKVVRGYLTVLVERIAERLDLEARSKRHHPNLISRILLHIDEHFSEPISLNSLADALCVSKYHISHCFSEKIGCSLTQYVHSIRVQYAQKLLRSTKMSITEIGYEAGFESASTFYRVFRALAGMSPRAYLRESGSMADSIHLMAL